jgi:four helix bundle protein
LNGAAMTGQLVKTPSPPSHPSHPSRPPHPSHPSCPSHPPHPSHPSRPPHPSHPSHPPRPSHTSPPNSESRFAFQRLDVYVAARDLAALVHASSIQDAELRDQATRAAKSCFLALAEGLPHETPGQRGRYFSTAHASLCEAVAAVDLSAAIGALSPARATEVMDLAARVRRMLTALRRPTGRAG